MDWLVGLPEFPGSRALDVATGSGTLARALAGRGMAVVGIDRPEAIARAEAAPNVRYEAMDAEALGFPDATFDLVAISWALHHLANPTRVLLEMRRVLAPGGTMLIVEPIRVLTGTNQDLHLRAHLLVAKRDRALGKPHFPIFERLQVGSVIQGLGLVELGFEPVLAVPEEAGWDLAACLAAGAPWVAKLTEMAEDEETPAAMREEARELAVTIRREGLRTGPVHRVFGRVPAAP